jgi:hypothetical protein
MRHLVCINVADGKTVWQKDLKASQPEKAQPELARHGYASTTPVSDGQTVYVFFGLSGVFASMRCTLKSLGPSWPGTRWLPFGAMANGKTTTAVMRELLC